MSKFLILGAKGQVGSHLKAVLEEEAIALDSEDADFMEPGFTEKLNAYAGCKAVINAAAYTAVDKAEGEGAAANQRINVDAVGELAQWCKRQNIPLVHYSTDYVYDGSGDKPRTEDAPTGPLNAYGRAKLEGEQRIAQSGCDYLIFRTSWVYNATAPNFFTTMLRLMKERESLNVVADQVGAPTYAPVLSFTSSMALGHALTLPVFPSGVYHLCGGGETSWHGFACAILALARSYDSGIKCQAVNPIPTSGYPTPARRPLNSRLNCSKAERVLGVRILDWEDGLKRCIEEKYGHTGLQTGRTQAHPSQGTGG